VRELIGLIVAVVIIFGVGAAIFSAIRHRQSFVRKRGGQDDRALIRHVGVHIPPRPPPRPPNRPTLVELRARVALAQAPPVCPDCGGIMHKEDDVDPEGIWFVSWRCDCLWTPTEGG
jgi:hypothetical protein